MSYSGVQPTFGTFPSDLFTANGSNTIFTMSSVPGNDAALLVTIDGVRQHTDTYSYSANTLTFSEAPPSGAIIETVNMGSRADVIVTDGVYRKTQFTATAAQTNFNISTGYTVGFVDVYLNGIRLVVADDFTANDGSTIILAVAAAAGDAVEVIAYGTFNVANALQKSGDTMSGNLVVSGTTTLMSPVAIANTTGNTVTFATTGAVTFNANTTHIGAASFANTLTANGQLRVVESPSGYGVRIRSGNAVQPNQYGSHIYLEADGGADQKTMKLAAVYSGPTGGNVAFDIATSDSSASYGSDQTTGAYTTRFQVDGLGRVKMPYQPMFDAYRNSGNVAASSTIVFNGTRSNIGSCYSTSTGRFTAPVAGAYQFNTQVTTADTGAFLEIQLAVNGTNRYSGRTYRTGSVQDSTGVSACIYLSAGDYVTVTTSVGNAYGVDERCALFSGHLIG